MLLIKKKNTCLLQVPVTAASASAPPKIGGCLEITASATTESVINTTASSAQVMKRGDVSEARDPYAKWHKW